jgi:predicted HAD superfamily Cof-like phosphohydrolase
VETAGQRQLVVLVFGLEQAAAVVLVEPMRQAVLVAHLTMAAAGVVALGKEQAQQGLVGQVSAVARVALRLLLVLLELALNPQAAVVVLAVVHQAQVALVRSS